MGLFAFAWITGEGLIIWRWLKNGAPPTPGALLLPSTIYLGLAVLAQYQPARMTAAALAWGFDVAVLLQIVGKDPKQATGWPPPSITDASQLLPGGKTKTTTASTTHPATIPAGSATLLNTSTPGQPVSAL
jgi:hypothetical protein